MHSIYRSFATLLLISCTSVFAQNADDLIIEAKQLVPESITGAACVDYEPIGDGWGWNGVCACRMPSEYVGFGWSMAAHGDRVVFGSQNSPGSCADSGTASVYKILPDGTLEQEAELGQSIRGREFPPRFFGGFDSVSQLKIIDGYIAVSTNGTLTVYENSTGEWQQAYHKVGSRNARTNFVANEHGIFWEHYHPRTLDDHRLHRYRVSDGELLQVFEFRSECEWLGESSVKADLLALSCKKPLYTEIHKLNDNNKYEYRTSFTAEAEIDILSDGRGIAHTRFEQYGYSYMQSATETESGSWITSDLIEYTNSSFSDNFAIFNDTLFIADDNGNLKVYELGSDSRWSRTQTVSFGRKENYGREQKFLYLDGNHLIVTRAPYAGALNRDNPLPGTISVFEYSENENEWKLATERETSRAHRERTYAQGQVFVHDEKDTVYKYSLSGNGVNTTASDSDCDYRNATQFDGWGWNPVAGTSCPPLDAPQVVEESDCDYRNAALFDGWGWNPVAGTSCPPLDAPQEPVEESDCDYRNAAQFDGWGWNPVAGTSCPPLDAPQEPVEENDCNYNNAAQFDGWGWDPVASKSCPPRD